MSAKLISAVLLFAVAHCFSQESLNQLDSAGKRNGKWIRYLDKDWKATEDSARALYFRYTFYDHGVNVHPMGPCGRKGWKLEASANTSKQAGCIQLLDGEYKWYDAKGRLKFVHVLKNGEYISYKEFYPDGQLHTFFDYTKNCEGQPHSWWAYIYDKDGTLVLVSPTCKNKSGKWPLMRG